MSPDEAIDYLLDEMEDYYAHFEHFPLYLLSWELRGLEVDGGHDLARRAFDQFAEHHPVRVVWTRWPIDLDTAWPMEPDEALVFDLDPDEDVSVPLQVLVPADPAQ